MATDPEEIKRKLGELRDRMEKSQKSLDKMKEHTASSSDPKPKVRKGSAGSKN